MVHPKIRRLKVIIRAEDYQDGELIATDEFYIDNQFRVNPEDGVGLKDSDSVQGLDILLENSASMLKKVVEQNHETINRPFGKLGDGNAKKYTKPTPKKKPTLLDRILHPKRLV